MRISVDSDSIDSTEQMTSLQFSNRTRHVTAHCRTDPTIESFNYVWTISNFWSIFRNVCTLTSDKIKELPFTIEMKPDKDKKQVCFHLYTDASLVSCFMYVEDIKYGKSYKLKTKNHMDQLYYVLDVSFLIPLWNNALTIVCQFFLLKTIMHRSICNVITEPEDMLPININRSVQNEFDSRVIIVAFEERFSVHKVLLSSRSTVFKAMFDKNPTVDEFKLIEIDHITRPTLHIFISFLQTGHIVKDVEYIIKTTLYQLFALACDYDVEGLKTLCRYYMIKALNHETAIESLTLAHIYNDENLRKFVIDYIKLHITDIKNSLKFVLMLQEYPELLMKFVMIDDLPIRCCEFSTSSTTD